MATPNVTPRTIGEVCWSHNRTFIVGKVGPKFVTGLVIEGGGVKTAKVPRGSLIPALFKGAPYPARKMRGHLRKMKALTKGAKALRKELLH
jgi:hypothetical protein